VGENFVEKNLGDSLAAENLEQVKQDYIRSIEISLPEGSFFMKAVTN